MCKDMAEWTRTRAAFEEGQAKQLMKIAKSNLGDMEEGGLKVAWEKVKEEMLITATSQQTFADALISDVEKALMQFKDGQKNNTKSLRGEDCRVEARDGSSDPKRRKDVPSVLGAVH